jgi:Zn-dependent peptidase ImmA (M78 family)
VRNLYLDHGTAIEINGLVDRLHKDIGTSNGVVDLAIVRDRLQLDLHYYTTSDPSLMEEVVHKMRVGASQVLKRPALLLEAIARFDLKALILPDRKRILIDSDLPDLKKRWNESHEIVHGLLPWHKDYLLGDTKETLSPACHQQIEAEANYGAGRLIFPHEAMLEVAQASQPSIAHVREIAEHFGNTITSALWRYVEYSNRPFLAIVGAHPHHAKEQESFVTYFIRSQQFERTFGGVTEEQVIHRIRGYCSYKKSGPLGKGEIELEDDQGLRHLFRAETFSNSCQVLRLVTHLRRVELAVQL